MESPKTDDDFEVFRALAEKLTLIPDCPRSPAAVEGLTEDLLRMCESEEEAAWLAREAREKWDQWRGVAGLAYLLHMHRHPPLPDPNRAADAEQKAKWIAEGATYDPEWTANLLKGLTDSKSQMREMHLKAIRDMLYYTEGEGQHVKQDGYWQEQRAYDLEEHADVVAWIRGGEVGEMPPLEPMSRRREAKRGPVKLITSADVEREMERYRKAKELAREREATEEAEREPGEGE